MSISVRSHPRSGRRRLCAAFCALSLVAGCGKEAPKGPAKGQPEVTVLTVTPREVPVTAVYVAQTQSSQAVNIQARVSGWLDKRMYVEGSVVKAGQVLFQMDPKPFQAQLASAKAALQRNQAANDVAKANLARVKPLAAQNALSQKDLDDAQGQFEQTAAAVEQSKAQLLEAQLNLSYTTIRSPVDGVSSYAAVADGTYVNPQNAQLTTVSVLTPMWINFSVSENAIERIRDDVRKGLLRLPEGGRFAVEIEMVDGSVFPYTGRITFADPSYNSTTGTFLLRATVDNPAGLLRPNQYVRARLVGAVRPDAVVVPQRAVQQGAKGHFAWVVNQRNEAELRPIVVGDWHGGDGWIVSEGLQAGDQVVVDGGIRLTPGAAVIAKPYVAPKAEPAGDAFASARAVAPPAAPAVPSRALPPTAAVYFARDSAALDAEAASSIRQASAALMGIGTAITVTGYADRTGSREANVGLAKRRAIAVRDALVANGIAPQRIRLTAPVDVTGAGSDDRARRVDVGLAP
jgi:membrane fusion protein (multidrug efflux system)